MVRQLPAHSTTVTLTFIVETRGWRDRFSHLDGARCEVEISPRALVLVERTDSGGGGAEIKACWGGRSSAEPKAAIRGRSGCVSSAEGRTIATAERRSAGSKCVSSAGSRATITIGIAKAEHWPSGVSNGLSAGALVDGC